MNQEELLEIVQKGSDGKLKNYSGGVEYSDITFTCRRYPKNTTVELNIDDTQKVELHFFKTLLCMYSDYFARMFSCGMRESNTGVINTETSHKCVNLSLNFIYLISSGKFMDLNLIASELLDDIFVLTEMIEFSRKCQIEKLMDFLDLFLYKYTNQFINIDTLNALFKYDIPRFIENAVVTICGNPALLFSQDQIGSLDVDVINIFKRLGNNDRSLYMIIHSWVSCNSDNEQYLPSIITSDIISRSTIQTDELLSNLVKYCPEHTQNIILTKINENYMKYRQIVNELVPFSEIISMDNINNSTSRTANPKTESTTVVLSELTTANIVETRNSCSSLGVVDSEFK